MLWACRTTVKTATRVTPFQLVYGHEAIVPAKIMVRSLRVEEQNELMAKEYQSLMREKLDDIDEVRR